MHETANTLTKVWGR